MNEKDYIKIWEQDKHVPESQKLDKDMIIKSLQSKVSKVSKSYYMNLFTYLTAILARISVWSMKIYGYRSHPLMLGVETGLLIVSLLFLGYGVFILMKIREINTYTKDLGELLKAKLKFLRFHYEIWLICTAIVVLILSFALNSLVDNQDGLYRINNVILYVGINVGILLFVYGVQKLTAILNLGALRIYLKDLERGYLQKTTILEDRKRRLKWIFILIGVILLITAVLGFLKFVGII
jgi:hypothetical protein